MKIKLILAILVVLAISGCTSYAYRNPKFSASQYVTRIQTGEEMVVTAIVYKGFGQDAPSYRCRHLDGTTGLYKDWELSLISKKLNSQSLEGSK